MCKRKSDIKLIQYGTHVASYELTTLYTYHNIYSVVLRSLNSLYDAKSSEED